MGRNVRTVAEGAKADDVPSVTVRTLNTVATAAHNNISPDDYDYIAGLRAWDQTSIHGEPTQEEWRELARQASEEKEPNKMIALIQQLIAKFDEGKRRGRSSQAESN